MMITVVVVWCKQSGEVITIVVMVHIVVIVIMVVKHRKCFVIIEMPVQCRCCRPGDLEGEQEHQQDCEESAHLCIVTSKYVQWDLQHCIH